MRLLISAIISLALLIGGVYGYTWYSGPDYKSPYEAKTSTQTSSQPVRGYMGNITSPPSDFHGPTFSGGVEELRIVATLSNSSVKIGDTLWIRVRLIGENAHSTSLLRMIIMSPEGLKVYDTYIWLPHRTLAPGVKIPDEETYNIAWKASKHPSANVEIAPGNYTFIIKTSIGEKEVILKGFICVVE